MKIDVFLTPHPLPPLEGLAVVIDVLRASSTITTAFAHGAKSIHPAATEAEARELAEACGETPLLGGERRGLKIAGFQLGNSPAEYSRAKVAGRKIIFTTTNGTAAIARAKRSGLDPILISCFLNLSATVEQIEKIAPAKVYLFCAGRDGTFSMEDAAFAGLLCQKLTGELSDSAKAALWIWERFRGDIPKLLRESEHGIYMEHIGFASDLELCSRVDEYQVVPQVSGSGMVLSL